MARQLITPGQIIPTALHQEMERSYLEYAMSVIVGRALPDVRDGLKPVHRRILYAMYELGLTPDRPFRKSARVVGDVLGKYHPHGDQSVYDALVRLVQDFSSRYPLLAGHGNFGSVDNDPPAAMRYTETRLAPIAFDAVLGDISEAIVDFTSNFDNSQQEPTVLPAQLPLLLLNGCSGIAVGMATNIPPHNLGEIVDGLIGLIDNPHLSDRDLFKLIPGPDFPTGGEILNSDGIVQAYQTGRGLIPVRGRCHEEIIKGEKKRSHARTALIVTELPYQVYKAAWIEKVASLVNDGKLDGISDLRDESDRQGMRVVIELKRDADPQTVLANLYRMTPLQHNFGVIFLALVENRPVQLSLRQLLEEFLTFRENTLLRQYDHELTQAQERLTVLEGLLKGLANLDALIAILRLAPDGPTAKHQLQEQLGLTPPQGDALLGMPLRRITGLEQDKLQQEYQTLTERVQTLQTLINHRPERLKTLKKSLRSLKKRFGDTRRTRILQGLPDVILPPTPTETVLPTPQPLTPNPPSEILSPTPNVPTETVLPESQSLTPNSPLPSSLFPTPPDPQPILQLDQETVVASDALPKTPGKIKIAHLPPPPQAYLSLTLNGSLAWHDQPLDPATLPDNDPDPLCQQWALEGRSHLKIITDQGKAYRVDLQDVPPLNLTRIPVTQLLPKGTQQRGETVLALHFDPDPQEYQGLMLLTASGRIKLLARAEWDEVGSRGLGLMKLRDGDRLARVQWVPSGALRDYQVIIATSSGRLLRLPFQSEALTLSSRHGQGQPALGIRATETLVGLSLVPQPDNAEICLLTRKGYGKRLPLQSVRLTQWGALGSPVIKFTDPQDQLLLACPLPPGPLTVYRRRSPRETPQIYTLQPQQLPLEDKDHPGQLLLNLGENWLEEAPLTVPPIIGDAEGTLRTRPTNEQSL